MKKYHILKRLALVSASAFTLTFACKDQFLEVLPTGSLAQAQLTSKAGVEGTLIGAYSALAAKNFTQVAASNNWLWGSILGGENNKGTDAGDFSSINPMQRYESSPVSGDINGTWQAKYEGIARANATINLANESKALSAAEKTRIIAEARFLRAHFYFELKRLFNSVPYVDETMDYGKGIEKVGNSPDIWGKIDADFKFAYDNLPETHSSAGRANKWAAGAYLGKSLLYQGKFAEAKALFTTVIASGKTTNGKKYGLVPRFQDVFNAANDNNEEAIFAIQSSMNSGSVTNANAFDVLNYPYNTGTDGPGNCCGFFQPSFSLANAYRTKDGLPLLTETNGAPAYNAAENAVKHDYKLASSESFTEDNGPLDPRIDHTIGRRGIQYLDWIEHPGKNWIRDQTYAGPYSPKKYVYYKTQENTLTDGSGWTRGYATLNYNIIRFSDVLLMAAEAEIKGGGSLATALGYINQVRNRAANPSSFVKNAKTGELEANYVIAPYTAFANADEAMKALKMERMLELATEGHRFFDLVRWGDASKVLNTYLSYEGGILVTMFGGAKFTTGKEYLPIPQAQIDIQGTSILKQNPGY
ncbi:RagB/SusD family nutrient uptake outer membrane protein [Cytophagaceae bacterium 50C-KIRBA]|uniref:RagB/SusD family nutrient uptake outer membrane protein n=1 Tax=Aquirufa beregesia TaxID=2516556 RepID=A0ABX0EVR4_9BACT|nr:RagB/SusD family nutrient uptake outer membrane protein [Aquirufa beregesia]NGZ44213.1 RagB/SusD family nutrient uptake outer membrane protein [Aquirufa beregesia]